MKRIILFAILFCFTSAIAEETEVKKRDIEWEYHLITWMPPHAERKTIIFEFAKESRCRTFKQRIDAILAPDRGVNGFGFVGVCAPEQKA